MIIGFTGASGTGKSWVAGELATQLGVRYQASRGAEVAEQLGFDVNAPHTFAERLSYQNEILDRQAKDIDYNDDIVLDRTPVDLMAYGIIAANDEIDTYEYRAYIEKCLEVAEDFDLIVLVSPSTEELLGDCEYKPGRLVAEVHGYHHRALFDATIKLLLTSPKLSKKLLVIPEDYHYQSRVNFVLERLNEYRKS